MSQSRKDELAEAIIKSAILGLYGPQAIQEIRVWPIEDHLGEAALAVKVVFARVQGVMSSSQLLDAIAAASTALREIDDYRFPYMTFLEPEDERASAEDTRPAA